MSTIEEEKKLLQGLADEDKTSIEKIYREHYSMVLSLVMNNNGSPTCHGSLVNVLVHHMVGFKTRGEA